MGENTPDSDIDICFLVLEPRSTNDFELSNKKLDRLAEFDLDVPIYQQLPLYIRHRVLREGEVFFRNGGTRPLLGGDMDRVPGESPGPCPRWMSPAYGDPRRGAGAEALGFVDPTRGGGTGFSGASPAA